MTADRLRASSWLVPLVFESEVKTLAAEDGFSEDIQGSGGLMIRIAAKVNDGFRVSHDGVVTFALHVFDDLGRVTAARGIVVFPFDFGEVLEERVDAFVEPRPLAFVVVDDHRKIVVADLVDDHADEAVFGAGRVSFVVLGARAVEAGSWPVFIETAEWSDNYTLRVIPYQAGPLVGSQQAVLDLFLLSSSRRDRRGGAYPIVALTVPRDGDVTAVKALLQAGAADSR